MQGKLAEIGVIVSLTGSPRVLIWKHSGGEPEDIVEFFDATYMDDEAVSIIDEYVTKGFLKAFDTLEDCTRFLGAPPVLSKCACLSKE